MTQSVNYLHRKTDPQLRSESSSSLDDRRGSLDDNKELINIVQCSSSSDSELDYKFDQEYFIHYNNLQNSRSLKLVDTNSVVHTSGNWPLDNSKLSRLEHKRIYSEPIDKSLDTESQIISPILYHQNSSSYSNSKDNVYEKSSSSTCSNSAVSKRSDRYIRDIDVLEVAGVPFSYEDVVYSTNEEFRHLRATRGLTEEQVSYLTY
ncbi:Nuclear factor (Erythroid-derived 2)-like 2 [Schistosoma haematobium]|uniref:Nuclear factor (Erythroid-derived 2)-like 2 n=1 Tax=Schistosoma haematobium TaxID=6185 RepID=A0A922LPC9_SCHHA|nr:Nuclear factor (Erythroid-derived 2)-like 2 [Schistosoma haematobium]KAH9590908.1 Nuclear factor (Erythroid-derived 2)-like 2 [Schistosoma haematobium]